MATKKKSDDSLGPTRVVPKEKAKVYFSGTEVFESEKDKLIREMQEKIEWMNKNQMSLDPMERGKKWEEVWGLDRKIKQLP